MFPNPCVSYILQTLYVIESGVEGLLLVGKIWRGKIHLRTAKYDVRIWCPTELGHYRAISSHILFRIIDRFSHHYQFDHLSSTPSRLTVHDA